MKNTNKRNKLIERPFSYKITNSDKVIIYHDNKQIMIIKGRESAKLQSKLLNKSEQQIQLLLAKITGNYKRGNE